MRRPRGTTDTAVEPESVEEEIRIQLVLFSEWLELQGFSKEFTGDSELTHNDLAVMFLGGVAR